MTDGRPRTSGARARFGRYGGAPAPPAALPPV